MTLIRYNRKRVIGSATVAKGTTLYTQAYQCPCQGEDPTQQSSILGGARICTAEEGCLVVCSCRTPKQHANELPDFGMDVCHMFGPGEIGGD